MSSSLTNQWVKRKALAGCQHHTVKQCFVGGSEVVGVFVFYEFAFLNVESLLCYWQEGCRKKNQVFCFILLAIFLLGIYSNVVLIANFLVFFFFFASLCFLSVNDVINLLCYILLGKVYLSSSIAKFTLKTFQDFIDNFKRIKLIYLQAKTVIKLLKNIYKLAQFPNIFI